MKSKKRDRNINKTNCIILILFLILVVIIVIFSNVETKRNLCPEGFLDRNGQCEKDIYLNSIYEDKCPEGFRKENGVCVYETMVGALSRYHCPSGYTSYGLLQCQKFNTNFNINRCGYNKTYSYSENACYSIISSYVEYYCLNNGILQGDMCYYRYESKPVRFYNCVDGYSYDSFYGKCHRTVIEQYGNN